MKRLLILLSLALLPSAAWAYTETFYLCATGDGSLPETSACATAWDAADFNTAGNWAAIDADDGKLGPNDLLILLDDGGAYFATLTVQASGLSSKPITIQGEASGTATVSASRFKTGAWTGPDGNGEYTTSASGVTTYLMLRDGTHVHYNNGLPGDLGEDEFLGSAGNLYYKPLAGHNPSEYTFEIPYRTICLSIVSTDYITVTGLAFRGSSGSSDATAAVTVDDADHVTISGCTFTFNTDLGFSANDATGSTDSLLFSSNTVTDSGSGVRVNSSTNAVIRDNVVHGIGDWPWLVVTWMEREGIGINGKNLTNDVLVEGNTVYDIGHDGVAANCTGISLYRVNGAIVQRNLVYGAARIGIRVTDGSSASAKNIAVRYNVVRASGTSTTPQTNEHGGGIVLTQENLGGFSTGVVVYNNTVTRNGSGGQDDTRQGGILYKRNVLSVAAVDITIKNNISVSNTTYDLRVWTVAGATGIVLDNNLYYRASGNMLAVSPGVVGAGVESWTAAGQTGASRQDDSSSAIENWRNVVEAGVATTSGNEIRVSLVGHSTGSYEVQGISIGVRSGTSDDLTGAPTRLSYGGAVISATNPITVAAGATVWTDWTSYSFDETVDHLLHVWIPAGADAHSRWDEGSGTNAYWNNNAADMTLYEIYAGTGFDSVADTASIEVRTASATSTYTQAQLATYQTDTGQDAHSVSADPLLLSATDFRLQPTSPAINAGTDVGLTSDYVGRHVPFGSAPDIGAYEWASAGSSAGPRRLGAARSRIGFVLPGETFRLGP